MKFLIDNWVLFAVAFGSGAMLLWPAVRGGALAGGGSLNANAAVNLMNREKAGLCKCPSAGRWPEGLERSRFAA